MFESDVIQDIVNHAADVYPEESCGFVVNGVYRREPNIHETPEDAFRIARKSYLKAERDGLQAIVHSHPRGENIPSVQDMESQIKSAVPWGIAPRNQAVFWFGDGVPMAPLEDRTFQFGVHDCVSAVRDWYKLNMPVHIPNYSREPFWWKDDPDRVVHKLQECGFKVVTDAYQVGDILVMSIGKEVLAHCAVYTGGDKIFHHVANRLSGVELIHRWENYIMVKLRYQG